MVVRHYMTSYAIAQPSYDCNRVHMLTSASRHTDILMSYDLIRLSYRQSYDVVLVSCDYLRACDCPSCVANPSFPV